MPLITQAQYNGGVNEEDFAGNLRDNEVRRAINAVISKRGSLKKREGSSEYGSDAGSNAVFGLRSYTDDAGTIRRLKMVGTNLVEYHDGAWDTVVKATLQAGKYLQMSDILVPDTSATVTGTATAGADYSLTDSGKAWAVNAYRDYVLKITAGTGTGQVKNILENTATQLVVDGRWDINPDATSQYGIYAKKKGLICNNGTDTGFKVIGGVATDLSNLPKFTVQLVISNRLWGILGTKIYWSDLANGEAIGNLNYIDTGETLVSLGKVGDFPAVYSKTKTGIIIGNSPDSYQFIWRDQSHGCIAPQSVANWTGYSFALAQDGVYVFDGTTNRLCSRRIKPTIDAMKASDKANASGFVFENKYYLMYSRDSASTSKDRISVMDLIWSFKDEDVGVWTHFEGINTNVMGVFPDANGLFRLYAGKSNSSKVVQLYDGSYADEESTITFIVDTKEFDLGAAGAQKKIGWFYYEGQTQLVASDIQLYRNLDGRGFELFGTVSHEQGGAVWDTAEFDVSVYGGADRIIKRLRPGGRCRTLQFEFFNNQADHPIELFKIECMMEVHKYH